MSQETIEDIIDVNQFINYAVVSYFAGNPDDLRNNYSNHFIYFLPSNHKAIFIPYDNDRTLGINRDWNPSGSGMTTISPYSNQAMGSGATQVNPIYRYSILEEGYFKDAYSEVLNQVATSKWMNYPTFESLYQTVKSHYKQQIRPSIKLERADTNRFTFTEDGVYGELTDYNMAVKDYMNRIL